MDIWVARNSENAAKITNVLHQFGFTEANPEMFMAPAELDGVPVNLIDRDNLKRNKRASGRLKDLADLEQLP